MALVIIRIKGMIGVRGDISETLHRLRLRQKYACIVIDKPSREQLGMLAKIRSFVAYGEIDDAMVKKLQEERKTPIEHFYRLHPPRGGFRAKAGRSPTKTHYPEGVLGDHGKDITKLLEKML